MASTLYKGIRRWLGQTMIVQNYRRIKSARQLPKYSAIQTRRGDRQQEIVFLCPATNVPRGGVKVIYNQTAIINSLKGQLAASILHPYSPDFNCTWFEHSATLKRTLNFDQTHDFVVIPEFWVVPHARLLHNLEVQYGIYVQNGYAISLNQGEELDAAYYNAALILVISEDAGECVKLAFPECANKVYRVHCSVSPDKFISGASKENIICYMPRKLRSHSQLVTFFLNKNIPPHWRVVTIEGQDENGVAAILGKSRIFLSFSELEGLSLPPIEAALSGCYVIGYTGEAAKEYWDAEIFTEIYSGDIKAFVKAVLNKINEIDSTLFVPHTSAIKNLANRYSPRVEMEDMQLVSEKVVEILDPAVEN